MQILKRRKYIESKRLKYEENTIDILTGRVLNNMKVIIDDEDGKELVQNIIDLVKNTQQENKNRRDGYEQEIFPSSKELPAIRNCWTTHSKIVLILEQRLIFDVTKKARQKFRQNSPPIYECPACRKVCLLKCEYIHHKKYCKYLMRLVQSQYRVDPMEPTYAAWKFSKVIVDLAMQPFNNFLHSIE